ncbi:uncharacterized protein LOC131953622 [Physella acuta]|uniref:uncharacterized protein LOC131953622 n=1 Tax=Physella acuta TaxID=109671 RepID=UPI0027DC7227|nr:uncharacterized protein LOC131953622 [Physella acuta]
MNAARALLLVLMFLFAAQVLSFSFASLFGLPESPTSKPTETASPRSKIKSTNPVAPKKSTNLRDDSTKRQSNDEKSTQPGYQQQKGNKNNGPRDDRGSARHGNDRVVRKTEDDEWVNEERNDEILRRDKVVERGREAQQSVERGREAQQSSDNTERRKSPAGEF